MAWLDECCAHNGLIRATSQLNYLAGLSVLDDIIELHRAGRLPEAEAGYRELLEANPEDAEVLHLLGILRGQAGDREEGLRLVQRAIERDPDRDVFQHTLGEMQLHAGRLDE